MSRFGVFNINGVAYDMDDLTLDEVEEIEGSADASLSEMDFGSAKAMKAIAFTLMKRSNPALEMSEVGKVKLLDFVQGAEEMPDTGPPAEGETESRNGSVLADSGVPDSAVETSTRG